LGDDPFAGAVRDTVDAMNKIADKITARSE
jgi:hypothetical protein